MVDRIIDRMGEPDDDPRQNVIWLIRAVADEIDVKIEETRRDSFGASFSKEDFIKGMSAVSTGLRRDVTKREP